MPKYKVYLNNGVSLDLEAVSYKDGTATDGHVYFYSGEKSQVVARFRKEVVVGIVELAAIIAEHGKQG